METHQYKEGSYHEQATKKFMTGASEVVFSEATVPIETFTYHKLMGPESSWRVRGVGSGVTSTQLNAKHNCQSRIEPSDSSIVSLLLKEVQSLRQEVTYLKSQRTNDGDDVEENQRNNTPLVGEPIRDSLTATPILAKNNEEYIKDPSQIENTTVLRDKGGAAHTSRSPHVLNQPNSLQGVNKSCITQIGKKHISATNRMENSTIGMPRPHNFLNQSYDQNTSMGENMNTSGCSNQSNIARRLNFDQREQGVSKHDRLTSTPSPLSRELMCSKVINPYATTQVPVFFFFS
ncbi:hypothetical protein Cgig2_014913 [Carnegiea gigantea]|uniref:Uncharacterized protein n=1 Tax=Carnegiea gigantea TaxID=171969 RepID=A0A9Q1JP69_9CARY|nr:hypothetical protein Cgig2_014913 [Carnegiea gigantea]